MYREHKDGYVEYAHSRRSAWVRKERRIFDYLFRRFYKDTFRYLNHADHRNIPKITTAFGQTLPRDFSALDLGTGTGRVPQRLIEYGVLPENIVGIDKDPNKLHDNHFPDKVIRVQGNITNLDNLLKSRYPHSRTAFELITANMVFHLLNYNEYVSCLTQVRDHVRPRTKLIIVVPHPLRDHLKTIRQYHSQTELQERSPWGDTVNYQIKTLQDYTRGLLEAGFYCSFDGTAGVGIGEDSNLLLNDEEVWSKLQITQGLGNHTPAIPHCFRYWMLAHPR